MHESARRRCICVVPVEMEESMRRSVAVLIVKQARQDGVWCATRGYRATRGGCGKAYRCFVEMRWSRVVAPLLLLLLLLLLPLLLALTLELALQDGLRRRATRVAGASLEFAVFLGECLSRGLRSPRLV